VSFYTPDKAIEKKLTKAFKPRCIRGHFFNNFSEFLGSTPMFYARESTEKNYQDEKDFIIEKSQLQWEPIKCSTTSQGYLKVKKAWKLQIPSSTDLIENVIRDDLNKNMLLELVSSPDFYVFEDLRRVYVVSRKQ
jgi:hypothetical protein